MWQINTNSTLAKANPSYTVQKYIVHSIPRTSDCQHWQQTVNLLNLCVWRVPHTYPTLHFTLMCLLDTSIILVGMTSSVTQETHWKERDPGNEVMVQECWEKRLSPQLKSACPEEKSKQSSSVYCNMRSTVLRR